MAAVVVTNGTQSASQITLHGLSFGKVAFHGNGAKTSMIFLGAAEDFVLSANFRRIGLQHTLSIREKSYFILVCGKFLF